MLETLLIRLGATPADPVDYALIDAQGQLLTQCQSATLSELKTHAVDRPVIALVPGYQVTLAKVTMPTRNQQRLRKAVPFAMEEQLNEDIDELHFALGQPDAEGKLPVAVIARATLRDWLAAFAEQQLDVRHMYPVVQAAPRPSTGWSLVLDEPNSWLQSAQGEALYVETDTLDWVLSRLGSAEQPESLLCYHAREQAMPALPEGMELARDETVHSSLTPLAKGLCQNKPIDFLQGEFARKTAYNKVWKSWRIAAMLAGIVIVLGFVSQGVAVSALGSKQARLTTQMEDVYRQAFPDAKRVVKPRYQMETQLSALRQAKGHVGADFLSLLALSGEVIQQSDLKLEGISFREGALDLAVTGSNVQSIDQLKTSLGKRPELQVEIQSASARDGKVEGRVRITGARS